MYKNIENYAQSKDIRFSAAIQKIAENQNELRKFGQKISAFVSGTKTIIEELKAVENPIEVINSLVDKFMTASEIKEQVKNILSEFWRIRKNGFRKLDQSGEYIF